MEAGKIEKEGMPFSEFLAEQMKDPTFKDAYLKIDKEEDDKLKRALEREWKMQEFKNAVVEAAKIWRRVQGDALHVTEVDGLRLVVVRAWFRLHQATDALIKFESENKV